MTKTPRNLGLQEAALSARRDNDQHTAALEAAGVRFDDADERPDGAVLPRVLPVRMS